jgi:hypothetical protein
MTDVRLIALPLIMDARVKPAHDAAGVARVPRLTPNSFAGTFTNS